MNIKRWISDTLIGIALAIYNDDEIMPVPGWENAPQDFWRPINKALIDGNGIDLDEAWEKYNECNSNVDDNDKNAAYEKYEEMVQTYSKPLTGLTVWTEAPWENVAKALDAGKY